MGSGPKASRPKLFFRADISRPQWRRDSFDGLLDYRVVVSALRVYPRLVFERQRMFGEIVLEYGSTNPLEASNLQPVGWCLDAWSMGADGIIPWHTVGNAQSWERADGTDHRIGSILDQMSCSARSSGSKRIFEVVYFAVSFRGRPITGE
jgi:hypothetical protein